MYARIPAPHGLYDDTESTVSEEKCGKQDDSKSNSSETESEIYKSETKSTFTAKRDGVKVEDRTDKPKNVSQRLWEKFKVLQKRTDDATKRSTEKRIKHLQKQTVAKIQEEFTDPEDLDILRYHDVHLGPPNIQPSTSTGSLRDHGWKRRRGCPQTDSSEVSDSSPKADPEWQAIKGLLTVNDHLKGIDHGKFAAKTRLEKDVDDAVAAGDVARAEQLSDRLANREFGKKISDAIDARNYLKDKKEADESTKAKRRKDLHWGFDHKQRWETKGNM